MQIDTTSEDYTLRIEYINCDGKKERIYNAIGYNPLTQVMSGNWKFETLDNNGNISDVRIRPLSMRQTYKTEMEYLCELCGYKVLDVNYHNGVGDGLIWILEVL